MISVVLPVHNGATHLLEAIDSVLGQTLTDLELLVIDDGSTDDSRAIVENAATTDPRLRLISRPHGGMAAALNVGIEAARHDWIARMDADDVSFPHRLARQLKVAQRHPEVPAWSSWALAIDTEGRVLSLMSGGPRTAAEFDEQRRAGTLRPIHATMLIRRDAILEVGGYDPRFRRAQDIELWDRLGAIGPIITVPEPLLLVRVHGESSTTTGMVETLRVQRYVAVRRAAELDETALSYDGFLEAERDASAWARWLRWRDVRTRVAYRRAGLAYATGRYLAAGLRLTAAASLRPIFVLRRVWRQVIRPRLTGDLTTGGRDDATHARERDRGR